MRWVGRNARARDCVAPSGLFRLPLVFPGRWPGLPLRLPLRGEQMPLHRNRIKLAHMGRWPGLGLRLPLRGEANGVSEGAQQGNL